MTEIRYAIGGVVFSEGDLSNFVCRIVGGEVEIAKGLRWARSLISKEVRDSRTIES